MKDLQTIMSDFSKIVIEQGTLMDQIDYNVYSANKNTVKAVDDLTE